VSAPSSLAGGVKAGCTDFSCSDLSREIEKPKRENLLVAAILFKVPSQVNIRGTKTVPHKNIL
jgi:hypothetical protein